MTSSCQTSARTPSRSSALRRPPAKRHGVFNRYEAFIHIVDSMLNEHAKRLTVTCGIPWRRPIASLNHLRPGGGDARRVAPHGAPA